MKNDLKTYDKLILILLAFTVLVDMFNGYFLNSGINIPISQVYKFILIALIIIRVIPSKDFSFAVLIFCGFQIAPLCGLIKTGDFSAFMNDFIFATKWFTIPLAYFYFKTLFQSSYNSQLLPYFKFMISVAFILLIINQSLGFLGLGKAFYHEGYGNATGTKGFIYAGNELTILTLVLGFIISTYFKHQGKHFKNLFLFIIFLLLAFSMTSKTVLGGVVFVFLIPYLSHVKKYISAKWFKRLVWLFAIGIPILIIGFMIGLQKSGFIDDINRSARVNNHDFLTILLSNRNNFVVEGWEAFTQHYSFIERFFGLGNEYYLSLVNNIAEIDFITWLFSAGIFGLLMLLFIIIYWFLNAQSHKKNKNYPYAQPVFIFLIFICIAANLAGHIFSSGIAAFQIGFTIALIFYKQPKSIA